MRHENVIAVRSAVVFRFSGSSWVRRAYHCTPLCLTFYFDALVYIIYKLLSSAVSGNQSFTILTSSACTCATWCLARFHRTHEKQPQCARFSSIRFCVTNNRRSVYSLYISDLSHSMLFKYTSTDKHFFFLSLIRKISAMSNTYAK